MLMGHSLFSGFGNIQNLDHMGALITLSSRSGAIGVGGPIPFRNSIPLSRDPYVEQKEKCLLSLGKRENGKYWTVVLSWQQSFQ